MKAITQHRDLTLTILSLAQPSIKAPIHDGDTITANLNGSIGVRLLGVDAPEISLPLPGKTIFTSLANEQWQLFLQNPFKETFQPFTSPLESPLQSYIGNKLTIQGTPEYYLHARIAEKTLETEVARDIEELQQTTETFQLFMAFAYEIMDRYGRLLGFINRHQTHAPRPLSYNERLLQQGVVFPYFIWPNINPFRKLPALVSDTLIPSAFRTMIENELSLQTARQWVRENRKQKRGVFATEKPLTLEPFELRFLARREAPVRYVVDLSKQDNILIPPQQYYRIPNCEDRLFIPPEFVPLFVQWGWKIDTN